VIGAELQAVVVDISLWALKLLGALLVVAILAAVLVRRLARRPRRRRREPQRANPYDPPSV
jgi:hypothetical protein